MEYDFKLEEELIVLVKCRHLNTLRLKGVVGGGKLPAVHHFSPSLTTLSLSNSKLKEDPMLTLGKLPNLTHLSLSLDAFEGVEMVCSEEGFPQLKFLLLFRLYNLEEWRVDEGAMPNLFKLEINACRRLKMVPDGLKFISTLQELNIKSMPHKFVRRLGGVDGEGEDQYKIQHVPNIQYKFMQLQVLLDYQFWAFFPMGLIFFGGSSELGPFCGALV
ncbi:putative disease resistance protein At1g59780 isoform X2 [Cornus florida]|uniref:putative disease resistance protein At1g59780 isoform X2 n=1 Tax=Cornus florida TaxID=4283 RepID=UPI0028966593|nr:putative disease resistance protein At1g59780 isoform X2 [Cornus florida]